MSIDARIRDAKILLSHGRYEGALLMVLVALAGTSRKRYPQEAQSDREAFIKFFDEEWPRHKSGLGDFECFRCRQDGTRERLRLDTSDLGGCMKELRVEVGGKRYGFAEVFYKYMRCYLVHEAALPGEVLVVPGSKVVLKDVQAGTVLRVRGGQMTVLKDVSLCVSDGLLNFLYTLVVSAPENAHLSWDD